MHVEQHGEGTPLLLIHGFPFDHRLWQPLLPHLPGDCRLLLPDLPGFGRSPLPPEGLSIAGMADALAALLDQLRLKRAVVAGHSMGGYVALAFARRHRDRLAGLGLIATHPAPDQPPKRLQRARQAQEVLDGGLPALAASMPPALTARRDWHPQLSAWIAEQSPAAVAAALRAMAVREGSFDLLPDLADLPVALVSGAQDALIPPELYQRMREALPQARETRFPAGGHMPMLEYPAQTAAALKAICPSD